MREVPAESLQKGEPNPRGVLRVLALVESVAAEPFVLKNTNAELSAERRERIERFAGQAIPDIGENIVLGEN